MIMRKLKVLQVIPFFAPAWGFGGPVRVCFDIAAELTLFGNKVTVLTTDALTSRSRLLRLKETLKGIDIVRMKNVSPYLSKEQNLHMPRGITKWLKNNVQEYDIAHIHTFFSFLSVAASKTCLQHGIPYILHLHESPVPLAVLGKIRIKKAFNAIWGRKILAGAEKVIVVSEMEKKNLIKYLPELRNKVVIIPNPIDTNKVLMGKGQARQELGFAPDAKIILSLSRIAPIKKIDLVIRALARLSNADNSYYLIIAGGGEGGEEVRLKHLSKRLKVHRQVRFLGQISGQRKQAAFAAADIFVLVSKYESFGLTALEALQNNLPVCVSREVGVSSDIIKYGCGLYADNPEREVVLAEILQKIYENREKMTKNCSKVTRLFSISLIIKKILHIYYGAINNTL